jgi:phosphoenolpyruvate carboxykinase (ATP)
MLTCDAYGVLPPVSRLTPDQAQYHFVSGYTSKTPGTEDGISEPSPTFSTCYGQPFIVLHPSRYAHMLADRMEKNKVDCWLLNTGWTGGKFGVGRRCPLKYTRAIVDAIHNGSLKNAEYENFPIFNLAIPKAVEGVPSDILSPSKAWEDKDAFNGQLNKMAEMFQTAFKKYEEGCPEAVKLAGPITA